MQAPETHRFINKTWAYLLLFPDSVHSQKEKLRQNRREGEGWRHFRHSDGFCSFMYVFIYLFVKAKRDFWR